jgi:prephenate dehydrogenase
MTALIIGLGLIGGSIAKALKKNSDYTVIGYDILKETVADALKSGAIDVEWKTRQQSYADITVLCTSPKGTIEFLNKNASFLKPDSVITDVCGVKSSVIYECEKICNKYNLHFIGGHPMAGKERSGFKNSDANLFNRASYILTPTENTSDKALNTAKDYITALKAAKITVTTPENHDRMIAFTSQLPHIIAGAYVKSPSCLLRHGFSAGSFKDVSRVATVDENLWCELFLSNKEMLLPEIDCLIENLTKYKVAIENNNAENLKNIIKQGRVIKETDLKETERE